MNICKIKWDHHDSGDRIVSIKIFDGLERLFMCQKSLQKLSQLDEYFRKVKEYDYHEVKLGRLIKTNDGCKQKGVDVRIVIDMILKAYENHYDIAVLVSGDDDLVDAVKTVKDAAGKQVYVAYYPKTASPRLIESFDKRIILDETILKRFTNSG